jgi:hypothetical protein
LTWEPELYFAELNLKNLQVKEIKVKEINMYLVLQAHII